MSKKPCSRLLLAALLCVPLLTTTQTAFADAPQLKMSQDQMITPADFKAFEAKFYQTLDPAAQRSFIATRSFVRISQQVLDKLLPASQLPEQPAGFTVKYLVHGDSFDLNIALAEYLSTTMGGKGNLVQDMTAEQMLPPSDLNPAQLTYYQKLDPADQKRFIATRSYMRLCQQVLDHKLPAYQLPDSPVGIRGKYLLRGEEDLISKAVGASLDDLIQRNPDATKQLFGAQ